MKDENYKNVIDIINFELTGGLVINNINLMNTIILLEPRNFCVAEKTM